MNLSPYKIPLTLLSLTRHPARPIHARIDSMSEVNPNYFKIPSDSLQFPLFSCADRKDPFTSFPLAIKLRGLSSICPTAVLSVRQDRFRSRCCLGLLRPMRNQFTAIILLNPCAFLVSCETSLQFVHVDSCAMRSSGYTFYPRDEFFEVNSLNASFIRCSLS